MFLLACRRHPRQWRRPILLFVLGLLMIDLFRNVISQPPLTRIDPSTPQPVQKIFIASMHWNNEAIIRSHWSGALLDLVKHYGANNVYVSISESGSWDNTKGALRELDAKLAMLGVSRSIEMSERTHSDDVTRIPDKNESGWIWTPRGKKELRRIPYLAGVRNQVMAKLKELEEGSTGQEKITFDKILWLNDVIFNVEDVTTLIGTRNGEYAAACSLDFSKPPSYYDTFALRDISGAKAVTHTWPFFLDSTSRHALIANAPTPVKSCWNGIVVFQAGPFYQPDPLTFRGIDDSLASHHLEGSECCLIHADNPLSTSKGVWLNPNVRVSYNPQADAVVRPATGSWPKREEKFWGLWQNRLARLTGLPRRFFESHVVHTRLRSWQAETSINSKENGTYCLINEMQVLVSNGWAHV